MMKKIYWKFVIIIVLGISVYSGKAGEYKYAGSFLELGIGARAMGMGGAYVSVANDGSAFYWNPAGVSTLLRPEIFGMYASLFKSLERHHHIGFTRPLYGATAISLNWIRLSVTDIPRYSSVNLDPNDPTGYWRRIEESTNAETWQELKSLGTVLTDDPLGFSNFVNDAFILTLAKLYKIDFDFGWQYFILPVEIPIGVNIKFLRQSLFNQSASGLGFDLGSMFKFGLDDLFDNNNLGKIGLGVTVKDLWNTKITWNTASRQSNKIKHSWHLGASYFQPISSINSQLLFAYAYEHKYKNVHHFGMEYVYYDRIAIRFGVDNSQFTAGIGLRVMLFNLDYAFRGHDLGGSHRISLSVRL